MIDPKNEKLIPIKESIKLDWMPRPNGRPIHLSTAYRWTDEGCRGIKLEFVNVGNLKCTSEAALRRFFERLSTKGATSDSETGTQAQQARDLAAAILDAAGI